MKRRPARDDCLRQCLARVLEMPVGKVPHFVRKHRGYWAYYMAAWLERRGYAFVIGNARARTFACTRIRGGKFSRHFQRWILIGKNRRGVSHAVVSDSTGVTYDGGAPLKGPPSTFIAIIRAPRD